MRNLKKSLALLLVFALILGFAANAGFNDVALSHDYAVEISALANLNILNGYPDGSFRPGATLTRAEAAAVIYRMITGQTQQVMMNAKTPFKDLPETHWASGYVAFCVELGIINGYPDGTFKPEKEVSYQEYIKMLMTALGYLSTKNSPISYPNGYIALATVQKVTIGVNASGTEAATRGMIAKLSYNAIMNATYKRIDATDSNKKPTIAKDVLGVIAIEGTLADIDSDDNITLKKNANTVGHDSLAINETIPTISGKKWSSPNEEYVGMNVSVMYKKDDVSGKVTIFGVTPVGNKVLTVQAADFVKENSFAQYKVNGNEKDLSVSGNALAYLNNSMAHTSLAALKAMTKTNVPATFTFISPTGSSEYSVVKVTMPLYGKVDSVTDKKITVKVDGKYVVMNKLDSDGEATRVTYYSGVKKDDRVAVQFDKDYENGGKTTVSRGKIVKIDKISSILSSASSGSSTFTFDGTSYKKLANIIDNDGVLDATNVGEDFSFYVIPGTNYIAEVEMTSVADSGQYLYVVASEYSGIGRSAIKAVNENGDEKTYYFTKNENLINGNLDLERDASGIKEEGGPSINGRIYGYTTDSDGRITKLVKVSDSGQSLTSYNNDTKAIRFGGTTAYLNSSSVVFVKDSANKIFVTKGAVASITSGATNTVAQASIKDNSANNMTDKVKAMLVTTTGTASGAESSNKNILGYLSSDVSVTKSGDKYVAYANVYYGGNADGIRLESPGKSSASEAMDIWNGASKGSVVEFDLDANGKVSAARTNGGSFTNYLSGYVKYHEGNVVMLFNQGDLLITSDTNIYRFNDNKEIAKTDKSAIRESYITEAGVPKAQKIYLNYKLEDGTKRLKTVFVKEETEQMPSIVIGTGAEFTVNDSYGKSVTYQWNGSVWNITSVNQTLTKGSTLTVNGIKNISGMSGQVSMTIAGTVPPLGGAASAAFVPTFRSIGSVDKTGAAFSVNFEDPKVEIATAASFKISDGTNSVTVSTSNGGTSWTVSGYTPGAKLYNGQTLSVTDIAGITASAGNLLTSVSNAPAVGNTNPADITVTFKSSLWNASEKQVIATGVLFEDKALPDAVTFAANDKITLTAAGGHTAVFKYNGSAWILEEGSTITADDTFGTTAAALTTGNLSDATVSFDSATRKVTFTKAASKNVEVVLPVFQPAFSPVDGTKVTVTADNGTNKGVFTYNGSTWTFENDATNPLTTKDTFVNKTAALTGTTGVTVSADTTKPEFVFSKTGFLDAKSTFAMPAAAITPTSGDVVTVTTGTNTATFSYTTTWALANVNLAVGDTLTGAESTNYTGVTYVVTPSTALVTGSNTITVTISKAGTLNVVLDGTISL